MFGVPVFVTMEPVLILALGLPAKLDETDLKSGAHTFNFEFNKL
jgi:hypothetical protein